MPERVSRPPKAQDQTSLGIVVIVAVSLFANGLLASIEWLWGVFWLLSYLLAIGLLAGIALRDGARVLGLLVVAQLIGVMIPYLVAGRHEPNYGPPPFLDLPQQVVMALSTAAVLLSIGVLVLGLRWVFVHLRS